MTAIENKALLHAELAAVDKKIDLLNREKIKIFFRAIGINPEKDLPESYLWWDKILVVVPNRNIMNELKPYKFAIEGLSFTINVNAERIHIFDHQEWEKAFKFKTQLQVRMLLKNTLAELRKRMIIDKVVIVLRKMSNVTDK